MLARRVEEEDAASEWMINDEYSSSSDDEPQLLDKVWQRKLGRNTDAFAAVSGPQLTQDGVTAAPAQKHLEPEAEVEQLRPVPPQVLGQMRASLAGPWCDSTRTNLAVRLWTFVGCNHSFIAGYLTWQSIEQTYDDDYSVLQLLAVPVFGGIGVIGGECTVLLGRALADVGGDGSNREQLLAPGDDAADGGGKHAESSAGADNFKFLVSLLNSSVSPAVADELQQKLLVAKSLSWVWMLLILSCYFGFFIEFAVITPGPESLPLRGVGWLECVLPWIGALCCWPCGMLVTGWLLFIQVPCLVVSDRIRQDARRVERMAESSATPMSPDVWDSLKLTLQTAHEYTVRLGLVLRPPLQLLLCMPVLVGSWWFVLSVTPSTGLDPRAPVAFLFEYFPPAFYIFGALTTWCIGVWPLYAPAEISTACDELAGAIEGLQHRGVKGQPQQKQQQTEDDRENGQVVPAADLLRIDGLVKFAADLNDGQGLGFTLRRKRIGVAFVERTLWLLFVNVLICFIVALLCQKLHVLG